MINEYYHAFEVAIHSCDVVRGHTIYKDERGDEIIFLRGDIYFSDDSRLHFREFLQLRQRLSPNRYSYAYHYQDAKEKIIFRYDNTEHFPNLSSAPHHKHVGENDVSAANAPDLEFILKEIEALIKLHHNLRADP